MNLSALTIVLLLAWATCTCSARYRKRGGRTRGGGLMSWLSSTASRFDGSTITHLLKRQRHAYGRGTKSPNKNSRRGEGESFMRSALVSVGSTIVAGAVQGASDAVFRKLDPSLNALPPVQGMLGTRQNIGGNAQPVAEDAARAGQWVPPKSAASVNVLPHSRSKKRKNTISHAAPLRNSASLGVDTKQSIVKILIYTLLGSVLYSSVSDVM